MTDAKHRMPGDGKSSLAPLVLVVKKLETVKTRCFGEVE